MIEVTRLNGISMMVNSDLIKMVESSPDTMLTLIHGEKLIIRESCEELMTKVLAYRATLLAEVAERLGAQGELYRVVSLASLGPELTVAGGRENSGIKLEQRGR
jgi:flagellar protein FlbD